ncbi:MAG: type II toxin-antitoxin system RelE/ParE family toxin [Planctomycetes bacterium]|nr:type II toxin-antitoxin system RelE/ParE family toxin [Planctomycetota bacterium]
MPFHIDFSRRALENLKGLRKGHQQIIVDAIDRQLHHQPDSPARQRKKLQDNELAPWELRIGDFRVFYDIDFDNNVVIILAIGKKTHNILRIGDEVIEL